MARFLLDKLGGAEARMVATPKSRKERKLEKSLDDIARPTASINRSFEGVTCGTCSFPLPAAPACAGPFTKLGIGSTADACLDKDTEFFVSGTSARRLSDLSP